MATRPAARARGDFTYESGRTSAARAVREGLVFDAVFAHNGVMAAAAMDVLQEAGRRVPEDVAVVGFDDLPLTTQTTPPLTAVHQPVRQMGEIATRALIAQLGGTPPSDTPVVIPTTLTVRASTTSR
jgi:LacI family transcriptional regulator